MKEYRINLNILYIIYVYGGNNVEILDITHSRKKAKKKVFKKDEKSS